MKRQAIIIGIVWAIAGCQKPASDTSSTATATATASTSAPAPSTSVAAQPSSASASASVGVIVPPDASPAVLREPRPTGGCPCGCDHSEDMVDELRGQDRSVALVKIDDSLHTIGEREDAGYITERMVQHRLRLLAYARDLGQAGPARFTSIPAARIGAALVSTTSHGVRVHADLMVHGETTEIVHGKEKALHASFVLRLDLENESATRVTLQVPTLDGSVGLPVSRWYVAGGDGERWSGSLGIAEKAIVYVIGYVGEPVPPGTEIGATVSFESITFPVKTRARRRWNETL